MNSINIKPYTLPLVHFTFFCPSGWTAAHFVYPDETFIRLFLDTEYIVAELDKATQ